MKKCKHEWRAWERVSHYSSSIKPIDEFKFYCIFCRKINKTIVKDIDNPSD